jgi:hypothetical protein
MCAFHVDVMLITCHCIHMTTTNYTVKSLYTYSADHTATTIEEAFLIGKHNGFSFAIYKDGRMVGTWCPIGGRSRSLISAMESSAT